MTNPPPPRSRGVLALSVERCTSCMLCVRECPVWCLHLEAHQERVVPESGGRPRTVNVLDSFDVDYGLCMFCGICVEVCPFDALQWRPDALAPESLASGLVHDTDRLASSW